MALYSNGGTGERMFPSTTWHWKEGSLRRGGAPESHSRSEGPSIVALRSRDPRKALDLQIRYLGGSEGLWEIRARGWRWRLSGGLSVADVMAWVNRTDG